MHDKLGSTEIMDKYKKELIRIIHTYIPDCAIYLFGSRARISHREGSDVDLAIDAGKKVDWNTMLAIKAAIEESTIPLLVDVVDMHAITDDFKEEILKDAILWSD